ncbi:BnaA02g05020D [Brassica napus]|uniref:Copper transport protein n=3 Tax=Brassica TaxID=3705 RepID=A0A078I6Q0_BRANA|nr:BnaA02g05020D [Brassica napus]
MMSSSSSSATDTITKPSSLLLVESVTCDTCGFAEECTLAYIHRVKERHKGHWLCGLCAEAVKDEVVRSPTRISVEEALLRHTTFCHRFRSGSPDVEEDPISVIGRILRRSLDGSPRRTTTRSSSSGALPGIDGVASRRSLLRAGSCFPDTGFVGSAQRRLRTRWFGPQLESPSRKLSSATRRSATVSVRGVQTPQGYLSCKTSQQQPLQQLYRSSSSSYLKRSKKKKLKAIAKMMHMTFYWGIKATILFDFWKTDSWLSYLLTLLACFVFAAFYQYLENRRLQFKSLSSTRHPPPPRTGVSAPLIPKSSTGSAAKAASVLLFGVNAAIGYLLMLAAMSFNGGVFIAIVVGLTVGYLVFRSDDDGGNAAAENPCACA